MIVIGLGGKSTDPGLCGGMEPVELKSNQINDGLRRVIKSKVDTVKESKRPLKFNYLSADRRDDARLV